MNNYKAWELDEENNLTMTALLLLFTSNEGLSGGEGGGGSTDLRTGDGPSI